jgi:hypothetical protein
VKTNPLFAFVIVFLIYIALAFNCQRKSESLEIESVNNSHQDVPKSTITDSVSKWLGHWVNVKYIATLLATKNPFVAQMQAPTPTTLDFGFEGHSLNKLIVGLGYSYHEGVTRYVDLEKGCLLDDESIPIEIRNDTVILGKEKFVRLNPGSAAESGILFEGTYQNGDQWVRFGGEGEISGLDSLKYYKMNLAYWDMGLNLPILMLGSDRKQLKDYVFRFNGDTLFIHHPICADMQIDGCYETAYGELLVKMIKEQR